ncbi:PucR family transcriptional regulator [Streptomyces sp. RPT161]|uniref:PucR family transcriptional regulator n=1 Tax=Streptomyces sp. RPT161 TaxID=3015993 RepID=UPI0022B8A16F|nr:helix-turn-helix domain-containing protein [Streptomyces sp. RPT161]
MTREWLLALRPAPDRAVDPVMPRAAEAAAAETLGAEPVRWAVQTAAAMAAEILDEVPEHGGGQAPMTTLRRSTESAVLAALQLLLAEHPRPDAVSTEETLEGCREFARRGVPLDRVLRGVRLGHARLARDLAAAIEEHVPFDQRLAELREVDELLFAYADAHASQMAEEYIAERDRWRGSDEAARRAIIDDLLAGRPVDVQAAIRRLRYDISRTHVAAVLRCDHSEVGLPAPERLQRTATSMARAVRAPGMLLIPATDTSAWVWLALSSEETADQAEHLRGTLDPPAGVRAALGPAAHGPQGMRRSHLAALQAERIALQGRSDWLCDYQDVRLVALATAEPEHARWFVQDVLGPLASEGARMQELRETLRVYLSEEHGLRTTAERLHVARNTVTYRVKRAQELLPTPINADNLLELRLALEIAHTLYG